MPKLAQNPKKKQSNVVMFPQSDIVRRAMHAIAEHVPGCHPIEMDGGWYLFQDDDGQNLFFMVRTAEVA